MFNHWPNPNQTPSTTATRASSRRHGHTSRTTAVVALMTAPVNAMVAVCGGTRRNGT
jgi:hypothetical protein